MDPIRSCIVCRNKKSKNNLFRIVAKNNTAIVLLLVAAVAINIINILFFR